MDGGDVGCTRMDGDDVGCMRMDGDDVGSSETVSNRANSLTPAASAFIFGLA